jgi:hypothetical protein
MPTIYPESRRDGAKAERFAKVFADSINQPIADDQKMIANDREMRQLPVICLYTEHSSIPISGGF